MSIGRTCQKQTALLYLLLIKIGRLHLPGCLYGMVRSRTGCSACSFFRFGIMFSKACAALNHLARMTLCHKLSFSASFTAAPSPQSCVCLPFRRPAPSASSPPPRPSPTERRIVGVDGAAHAHCASPSEAEPNNQCAGIFSSRPANHCAAVRLRQGFGVVLF